MREIYAKHQTTLMPSDRNQVKTLQVDEQITRITTTKSRSAAGGNDEMQPEVCEDNGGKKARRRDHDQNQQAQPTPGPPHSTRRGSKNGLTPLHALVRQLESKDSQSRERVQRDPIKDSIGHVKVSQIASAEISAIENDDINLTTRSRP